MADQQQEPKQVDVNDQPSADASPQAEEKQLSPEEANEAMAKAVEERDTEAMERLGKQLFNETDDAESTEELSDDETQQQQEQKTDDSTESTETEEGKQPESKLFTISYRGKEISFDDHDNLLGYHNTGTLKKTAAHQKVYITDLEDQLSQLREQVRQGRQNEAKVSELQQKLNALQETANKAPQQQPQQQAPPQQEPPKELPPIPKRPELSTNDPALWSDEDREQWDKYQKQRDAYDEQVAEYLKSGPTVRSEVPPEVQQELESLRNQVNEQGDFFKKANEAERLRQQSEADRTYWNNINDFASSYKDHFGLTKHINDVDKEVKGWMHSLGSVNGVREPLVPKVKADGTASPEWTQYNQQISALTAQYLRGDEAVVNNASGLEEPKDARRYFKIAEIITERDNLVADGRLGANATLEDAFLFSAKNRGDLDKSMEAMAVNERSKGAQAAGEALQESLESATTMPPNASGGAPVGDLTDSDVAWFNDQTPQELASDPAAYERWMKIGQTLQQNNFLRSNA